MDKGGARRPPEWTHTKGGVYKHQEDAHPWETSKAPGWCCYTTTLPNFSERQHMWGWA